MTGGLETSFIGQDGLLNELAILLRLLQGTWRLPGNILIRGAEGSGRTKFAKLIASKLNLQPVELDALLLFDEQGFKADFRELPSHSVLLLRDVGNLDRQAQLHVADWLSHRNVQSSLVILRANSEDQFPSVLLSKFRHVYQLSNYTQSALVKIAASTFQSLSIEATDDELSMVVEKAGDRQPGAIIALISRLETALKAKGAFATVSEIFVDWSREPSADHFMQMTGLQFERYIAEILLRFGLEAKTTRASGDGGIDISANYNHPIIGGEFVFQCKRTTQIIGRPLLQQFFGAVHHLHGRPRPIFVTTSSFSIGAQEYAATVGIKLIDGGALRAMLRKI